MSGELPATPRARDRRTRDGGGPRGAVFVLALVLFFAGTADEARAQDAPFFDVTLDGGAVASLPLERDRGYPAVPADALSALGWTPGDGPPGEALFVHDGGATLRLWPGSPMLVLNDQMLQMADRAYLAGGAVLVPLQLIVDLIPEFGPGGYTVVDRGLATGAGAGAAVDAISPADPAAPTDVAVSADVPTGPDVAASPDLATGADVAIATDAAIVAQRTPPQPGTYDRVQGGERLVVIDAGHGGMDVGAVGPAGATEKSIALSVALALARELASRPGLDVRVIRDRDIEVPIEYRRDWTAEWSGDRASVFVSIHANTLPERPGVRGFETYSRACPASEQELRVSAIENGAMSADSVPTPGDPDLGFVCSATGLSESQRLSAELAMGVQEELGAFHPGPDRGVRQAYLDVLTDDRIGVLIEVGFLTNREEARALTSPAFHRQAAAAIARAIDAHFEATSAIGLP